MDIVKEKEFIELTAQERAELGDLCASEEEYNQVKSMFAGISSMDWSNPTPRAETKESLDHLFAQKYPKAAPVWYNAPLAVVAPKGRPFYRQPLVQVAAIGLLALLAYPFVNSTVMNASTDQVALLEKKDAESLPSASKEKEAVAEEKTDVSKESEVLNEEEVKAETGVVTTNETPLNMQERELEVPADPARTIVTTSSAFSSPAADVFAFSGETMDVKDVVSATVAGASVPGSTHPDGVFIGEEIEVYSVPASAEPAVFDLLTTTF